MAKILVENGAELLKQKKDGVCILHTGAMQNDVHLLDYALKLSQAKLIDPQTQHVRLLIG